MHFLKGIIHEEIYMTLPRSFTDLDKTLVCRLNKCLYRLKQASTGWHEKLTHAPLQFGFTRSRCDHSLFVYCQQGVSLYALIYVDDILITRSSFFIVHKPIIKINDAFALKRLGKPTYFMEIEVKPHTNGPLLIT